MKRISQINESKYQLEVSEDAVCKLSKDELEKYMDIAAKFISIETKKVCQWLIDNEDKLDELLPKGPTKCPLANLLNNGVPVEKELKEVYKNLKTVAKSGRYLEIPVFMTKEQFDAIINKEVSPDEIIIDLVTEKGRNEVAKKYTPLVHKIVNEWIGKSSLDRDELFSYGMLGLTWAMNGYGKKSNKAVKKEEKTGIEIDTSKYKAYTFLQFASQIIRVSILEAIKNDSHLVRIPVSRQKKEKDENGFIAKSNSVSGDKNLGSKDGGEGKTLFDLVGGMENPGKSIDKREIDDLWGEIMKALSEKFSEQTMDIFMNHFGFGLKDGQKKKTGKEMAEKYGYSSPSSITAEIAKVINFIKKDKKMFQKFVDISELMAEAKHDEDEYDDDNEPVYLNYKIMEEKMNGLNAVDGDD